MTIPRFFFGFWKISDTVSETLNSKDIVETEFELTTTGNVIWKTTSSAVYFPLLNCKIYVAHKSSYQQYCKFKFATYNGHIIDCEIVSVDSTGGFAFNDGWCTYICKRINKYGEYPAEVPFSFLPALQNSYFSDLVIRTSNKIEFQVHRYILKYAAPKLDWHVDPPPLSGYSDNVVSIILHFLYSGCLPKRLREEDLNNVISVASDLPGMEKLISLCFYQKENLEIKKKIIDLVSDFGMCVSIMRDTFVSSKERFKILTHDFEELYSSVKKSFQEGAVGITKFLLICKIYASGRAKLSQEEDLEILDHILTKIPVFNTLLKEYAHHLLSTIRKIACIPNYWHCFLDFLIPKAQAILETVSTILLNVGECSASMASALQDHYDDFYIKKSLESFEDANDPDFEKSPMSALLFFIKEFKGIIFHFEKEKRRFNRIDTMSKIQLVSVALDDFLVEIAGLRDAFTEFNEFIENQVIKGKIYFGMKAIAMKTNDILTRVIARRASFVDLLLQFCDLVERDSFFESVVSLGFLDPPQSTDVTVNKDEKPEKDMLPVVESACQSPPAYLSHLSEVGNQLLESRDSNDMVFEVIYSKEVEGSAKLMQSNSDGSDSDSDSESVFDLNSVWESKDYSTPHRFEVKAHRAIISSRCDWFRRALASGMKEDINRKIEIHTTPALFSLFLEFVYTGCIIRSRVTFDDLLKLLFLSDRYDFEHLKGVCEYNLKNFIDEQSVFFLFNLSDQSNANQLKLFCEDFITAHPAIVCSDRFRELPENLKGEAIVLSKGHAIKHSILLNVLCNDTLEEIEQSLATFKKRFTGTGVQASDYEIIISSIRPKLEKAMEQLQERIDYQVPRRILTRIILDADYDVDRAAILFYLRSQQFVDDTEDDVLNF